MNGLISKLNSVTIALTLTLPELRTIAADFAAAMAAGLAGKKSSLKMLPAHLGKPTGNEQGRYLALDFGGTNVRVLLVELAGCGRYSIEQQLAIPLKDPAGAYDYTTRTTKGTALFDFLAQQIISLTSPDTCSHLGHTFSFPCRQQAKNEAILIHWTKEIATNGVEGQDVGRLLDTALTRVSATGIKTSVILNDTVGTLITSAYRDKYADIGSICGTGHNTCYFEHVPPWGDKPMIINLESGNFDQLRYTAYDQLLDAASDRPGEQRLEKMVAGRYLGELIRLILLDCSEEHLTSDAMQRFLRRPYILTGETIGGFLLDDSPDLSTIGKGLAAEYNLANSTYTERLTLKTISEVIVKRSAYLVAATYAGILRHIDPNLSHQHSIAIDGSLYEKMPGYAGHVRTAISEVLSVKTNNIELKLTKNGSGIGAAIAAAVVAAATP